MANVAGSITAICAEPIVQLGYELVDVEFRKEQGSWVLTLFIDKPGGVTVDDCEAVSRVVDPLIEEADPIPQSYFLSVSSPGLDRPFKSVRDYERHFGEMIVVKLYAKRDGAKEFTGNLLALEEDHITVACKDGVERVFSLQEIAQARPYIAF